MKKLTDQEVLDSFYKVMPDYCLRRERNEDEWDDDILKFYWSNFSRFIELTGNELKDLHFPKLDAHLLSEDTFSSKIKELKFYNCTFFDEAYFKELNLEKIEFSFCTFNTKLSFADFSLDVLLIINSSIGEGLSLFNNYVKSFTFNSCKIFDSIYINDTVFSYEFKIDNLSIGGSISFENCYLSTEKEGILTGVTNIDINLLDFKWFSLIENIKSGLQQKMSSEDINSYILSYHYALLDKKSLIDYVERELNSGRELSANKEELIQKIGVLYDLKYLNSEVSTSIHFENVIVTEPFTLHWLSLENFGFLNSEIEKIKFSSCDWNIKNRLILASEGYKSDIENQYRQLKRMFAKEQDWEMSGYAYISEMEMRRERLGYEIDSDRQHLLRFIFRYFNSKALEYVVYSLYGFLGGYTQNFARPLSIFLISTFLLFPCFYLFLEPSPNGVYSLTISIQKSVANSLPLIKTDYNYQYWWLRTLQIIFSSTLLAFIVLGLRKRFKQ